MGFGCANLWSDATRNIYYGDVGRALRKCTVVAKQLPASTKKGEVMKLYYVISELPMGSGICDKSQKGKGESK